MSPIGGALLDAGRFVGRVSRLRVPWFPRQSSSCSVGRDLIREVRIRMRRAGAVDRGAVGDARRRVRSLVARLLSVLCVVESSLIVVRRYHGAPAGARSRIRAAWTLAVERQALTAPSGSRAAGRGAAPRRRSRTSRSWTLAAAHGGPRAEADPEPSAGPSTRSSNGWVRRDVHALPGLEDEVARRR